MLTKQDIFAILVQNRQHLATMGVRRLGLFGSFVRGKQGPDSDVDLLVEFLPGQKTFDHFMEACFLLESVLQRRVELITTEALSPYLGPRILEEAEYVAIAA